MDEYKERERDTEWNMSRWKELETLGRALRLAGSLNRGNMIVEHIRELELLCEKLVETRWSLQRLEKHGLRKCLVDFLKDEARFAYANRRALRKLRKEHQERERAKLESKATGRRAKKGI